MGHERWTSRAGQLAALSIVLLAGAQAAQAADAEGIDFFEKKIRPLLVARCYECHSANSDELQANLLLDTRGGLLKGGDSGPSVIAGRPDKSLLIEAVRYRNEKLQMPPDEKLSDAEIANLEAWVKRGAPDPRGGGSNDAPAVASSATTVPSAWIAKFEEGRKHWAFQKPLDHAAPAVKNAAWAKQPLDRFILAKLEENGLTPAPRADRRTLIRRAYFELVGLSPPAEAVEAFVKDEAADAYEKLIDTLLASPQYGQRWARHWLDVVRYTDSFDARVLGGDQDVAFAWRYRDWVVDALNDDLPYDEFVKQQIAGDLLPPPQDEKLKKHGLVATGVYVLGEWGGGDSDKDKLITDIVDDQVDLTGRAFLGLTLACARCHDHKFDPISTKDYYGLAGIFFSTHILNDPGPKTAGPTNIRVPLLDEQEMAQRKADEARVAQLKQEMDAALDAAYAKLAAEMLPQVDQYLAAAWAYQHATINAGAPRPSIEQYAEQRKLHPYALRQWVGYLTTPELKLLSKSVTDINGLAGVHALRNADAAEAPVVLVNTKDVAAETLPGLIIPAGGVTMHPSPTAGVAVAWKSPVSGRVKIAGNLVDGHAVCGDGIAWSVSRMGGKSSGELASGTIANGGQQALSEGTGGASLASVDVATGDVIQLAVLPKVEYSCDTTQVDIEIIEISEISEISEIGGAGGGAGGGGRRWNLQKDVAAAAQGSNPIADAHGNGNVWHFHDLAGQNQAAFAAGSPIARFNAKIAAAADAAAADGAAGDGAADRDAVSAAAAEVGLVLREVEAQIDPMRAAGTDAAALATPDAAFYEALTSPRGSFWSAARADDANLPAVAREELAGKRAELKKLEESLAEPIPVAQGMREGGTPKSMFAGIQDVPVHIRGRYDRLGEIVPRRFPQVIAGTEQKPITDGSGRLELARWIASPDHPLTARVMVNRIWQHHFGAGLVRTPNNYGKLGTAPTHPELLDHLALEFVRGGWSIKKMHRTMMLSATYMQSSDPSPEALKMDPANELLARMNRRKLEAEALRDAMLSVAGVLDDSAGGKAINDLSTPRRSLYVMTIRSDRSNYPALFDAADASAIVEKRNDSIVAPQALFLMNHPFALAQAKQLAERVARAGGADDAAKIDWLYRTLFSRPPQAQELEIANKFLAGATEPDAKWQAYCQVLLCTNEFMYVD